MSIRTIQEQLIVAERKPAGIDQRFFTVRPQNFLTVDFKSHQYIAKPMRNTLSVIALAEVGPTPASQSAITFDQFDTISRSACQRIQNAILQSHPFPRAGKVGNLNPPLFFTGAGIQPQAMIIKNVSFVAINAERWTR